MTENLAGRGARRTITVTAKDILLGQNSDGADGPCFQTCAIARALQRTFRDPKANWAYAYGDSGEVRWFAVGNGRKIHDFVVDHDAGRPVRPFKFKIEVRP